MNLELTQQDMARALNVSFVTYSRWENEHREIPPDIKRLLESASALLTKSDREGHPETADHDITAALKAVGFHGILCIAATRGLLPNPIRASLSILPAFAWLNPVFWAMGGLSLFRNNPKDEPSGKENTVKYRHDPDLDFLRTCANEHLQYLVDVLIKDKDGDPRWTEELTESVRYKQEYPNHQAYWDLIAAEVQLFGANSIASAFRGGEGVLYKEVLTDVCSKMKVNFNKKSPTEVIEMNLLMKILLDCIGKLEESELKEVVSSLDLKTTSYTPEAVTIALQAAIRMGGFASYTIALTVANAVLKRLIGRGLSLAVNAAIARVMSIFAGPIGWIITGLWTAIDIAGPAYRVTIPACVVTAWLRRQQKYGQTENAPQS
jgi:uncharacterized protein YaaW (UPF0174 family)/transcriptional regulator with XRE-family HTH domain